MTTTCTKCGKILQVPDVKQPRKFGEKKTVTVYIPCPDGKTMNAVEVPIK